VDAKKSNQLQEGATYVKELSFRVAAKTARLFGRENVSNAEGAISELVKNTYDADATMCLVCFIPRFSSAPKELTKSEFDRIHRIHPEIGEFYAVQSEVYERLKVAYNQNAEVADELASSLLDLWLIDNGDGMTAKTIEDNWMVIGTNNKEKNSTSDAGRARTGAKGIGRFALDRLGSECQLFSSSATKESVSNIEWIVNWDDFDAADKTLEDIKAVLQEDQIPLEERLRFLRDYPPIAASVSQFAGAGFNWLKGTAIRIGLLRDDWQKRDVQHLYKMLAELIPPLDQRVLNLFLFDAREPNNYGVVTAEVLEDYDYKIDAEIGSDGAVKIKLVRNELDVERIDPDLFEMDEMLDPPYDEESFRLDELSYTKTLDELFPGAPEDFKKNAEALGSFKVSLRFYKKGAPSARDSRIYPYRAFQPGPRKAWIEEFGGLKIYRDNFAVRPYGELGGRAFDWLSLGQRVAINPVQASRKGWKVSPQNLAGTVTISRLENAKLNDQSNREGIIENEYFATFRELVKRVIQEFEDDRSHIHFNLNRLYQSKNEAEKSKSEGAEAAARVTKSPEKATVEDAQTLARAYTAQQEEIRELRDEQTMLRALATLGTVLISFSHEMGQLQNTMSGRSAELSDILSSYIDRDSLTGVGGAFNPFEILEEWEEDDKKVRQWFTFALSSIRADKRRRKKINLMQHLQKTKKTWKGFLEPRQITLEYEVTPEDAELNVLAFEIDLDSVFNNLILNSVEALLSDQHQGARQIMISVEQSGLQVRINYCDNGPGLDPSIRDAASIFKFAVTTKRDASGQANGTGLGMWILAAVVQAYGGSYRAYGPGKEPGFRMEILLPLKK
jgi:signal transduction histidine kinase